MLFIPDAGTGAVFRRLRLPRARYEGSVDEEQGGSDGERLGRLRRPIPAGCILAHLGTGPRHPLSGAQTWPDNAGATYN